MFKRDGIQAVKYWLETCVFNASQAINFQVFEMKLSRSKRRISVEDGARIVGSRSERNLSILESVDPNVAAEFGKNKCKKCR